MLGDIIYSGAHGKQSFAEDSEPMTIETAGLIASMTKLMTSLAAMQVVEKGLIGLDDDLGTLIPDLRDKEILTAFDEATNTSTYQKSHNKITLRYAALCRWTANSDKLVQTSLDSLQRSGV